jgi:hypothetical protein
MHKKTLKSLSKPNRKLARQLLQLHKETIRTLSANELDDVHTGLGNMCPTTKSSITQDPTQDTV